jgi:hypothetical protein
MARPRHNGAYTKNSPMKKCLGNVKRGSKYNKQNNTRGVEPRESRWMSTGERHSAGESLCVPGETSKLMHIDGW